MLAKAMIKTGSRLAWNLFNHGPRILQVYLKVCWRLARSLFKSHSRLAECLLNNLQNLCSRLAKSLHKIRSTMAQSLFKFRFMLAQSLLKRCSKNVLRLTEALFKTGLRLNEDLLEVGSRPILSKSQAALETFYHFQCIPSYFLLGVLFKRLCVVRLNLCFLVFQYIAASEVFMWNVKVLLKQ